MSKEGNDKKSVRGHGSSKFGKTFLTVLSALLAFAGPTYGVYVLSRILKIGWVVSVISGSTLFVVGVILVWLLIKDEDIA